jgi:hypothetical protein
MLLVIGKLGRANGKKSDLLIGIHRPRLTKVNFSKIYTVPRLET